MSALTINLSDDLLEHLTNLAQQVNTPPQDLARAVIEDALRRPSAEFERLLEKLLHKNAELYQRLAAL